MSRQKKMNALNDLLTWGVAVAIMSIIILMLYILLRNGFKGLDLNFLMGLPQELDAGGGIGPFLFNSFYVLVISLLISVPVGIGAGICLSEYAPENGITRWVRMSVEALASVPSIVFGLFGMAIFVDTLQIGLTIIGAGVTLSLLNLPVITRVTEESLKSVAPELREAAYALGATKFQVIWEVVLPAAANGILTGIGLASGRAFGESAVILLTAGTSTSGVMWDFNLFSPGETLAVHLWYVQAEAIVPDAREIADRAAAVLVIFILMFNAVLRLPLILYKRRMG